MDTRRIIELYLLCETCDSPIPQELHYPMFIQGGYHNICPFCAEQIMGGLQGEMACEIRDRFAEWWGETPIEIIKYFQAVLIFSNKENYI